MRKLLALYVSLGYLTIAFLVTGCDSGKPNIGVSTDARERKDGREYLPFCGQPMSIDLQAAQYSQGYDGLSVRISIDRALGLDAHAVTAGFVDVLVRCGGAAGGVWEKGNPEGMRWSQVAETPWGLVEHRLTEQVPYQAVFTPVKPYQKVDGFPFLIVCRTNLDLKPVRCSVDYEVKPGLHLSYTYQASENLGRWEEIDQIVRTALRIEN